MEWRTLRNGHQMSIIAIAGSYTHHGICGSINGMKNYTYRIIIEPDGNEYHGYVPALPGCHTHGATIEKTREHLRDAMQLYLEHLGEGDTTIPKEAGLESFETISLV
jgi:predicted RNase H-like HicB family nuclease